MTGLFGPTVTAISGPTVRHARGGGDGLIWPHPGLAPSEVSSTGGGRDGVKGGVVRGDPAGCAGRGAVDPGVGPASRGAPADGAAGVGSRRPRRSGRRRLRAAPQLDPVQGVDRRDADRGPDRAAEAAAHRAAGARPAGRRARRWTRCRTRRCATTCGSAGRRSGREAGRRPRRCSCRRRTSRVRRPRSTSPTCGSIWAGRRRSVPVHVPAVVLGQGGPPGVRRPRARRRSWTATWHAFTALGGVPTGQIRYDNLTPAVHGCCSARTQRGSENDRWVLFRSHFGFDAFYCQPGIDGAHEKGGVEGEGGRFRRTHLVPMPQVAVLAELNASSAGCGRPDDRPPDRDRIRTVGQDFAPNSPLLRAAAGRAVRPRADADPAGRPVTPGSRSGRRSTRCRPGSSAAGSGCRCGPHELRGVRRPDRGRPPRTRVVAKGGSRARAGPLPGGAQAANPAPCPGRPRWPRPARPGRSPPPTTRSGPRPARPTATPTAPGN